MYIETKNNLTLGGVMKIIIMVVISIVVGVVLAAIIDKSPNLREKFEKYYEKNLEAYWKLRSAGVPDWAIALRNIVFWPTVYLFMQFGNKSLCLVLAQFVTGWGF